MCVMMKHLTIIVCTFFIVGFAAVDAIKCYKCIHLEDSTISEPSCEKDPISILSSTCNRNPYQELLTGRDYTEMCVTVTGFMDGMPVVSRGCTAVPQHRVSELNGKCNYFLYYPLSTVGGRNVTNGKMCYCSKDNCNAASHLQYSCIMLFAFAVLLSYRFVSI